MGRYIIWGPTRVYIRPNHFNIFLSDLSLIVTDSEFASYADDHTVHKETADLAITSLQNALKGLFEWFSNNEMKKTTVKFH